MLGEFCRLTCVNPAQGRLQGRMEGAWGACPREVDRHSARLLGSLCVCVGGAHGQGLGAKENQTGKCAGDPRLPSGSHWPQLISVVHTGPSLLPPCPVPSAWGFTDKSEPSTCSPEKVIKEGAVSVIFGVLFDCPARLLSTVFPCKGVAPKVSSVFPRLALVCHVLSPPTSVRPEGWPRPPWTIRGSPASHAL